MAIALGDGSTSTVDASPDTTGAATQAEPLVATTHPTPTKVTDDPHEPTAKNRPQVTTNPPGAFCSHTVHSARRPTKYAANHSFRFRYRCGRRRPERGTRPPRNRPRRGPQTAPGPRSPRPDLTARVPPRMPARRSVSHARHTRHARRGPPLLEYLSGEPFGTSPSGPARGPQLLGGDGRSDAPAATPPAVTVGGPPPYQLRRQLRPSGGTRPAAVVLAQPPQPAQRPGERGLPRPPFLLPLSPPPCPLLYVPPSPPRQLRIQMRPVDQSMSTPSTSTSPYPTRARVTHPPGPPGTPSPPMVRASRTAPVRACIRGR